MNNLECLLTTTIAGLSTIVGNLLIFINPKHEKKILAFSMGLSFIVMFLISILDLIPEGLRLLSSNNYIYIFISTLLYLLIGYSIVNFLDNKMENNNPLYKIGILSMISLLIHNIPEGIICAITSLQDVELGFKMTLLIMIHNIPEGICISLPIYYSTKSKGKAFIYSLVSGLGEVAGALITIFFLNNFIDNYILYIILIITAGIMITLSIKKILREGLNIKKLDYLLYGMILGSIIIFITL